MNAVERDRTRRGREIGCIARHRLHRAASRIARRRRRLDTVVGLHGDVAEWLRSGLQSRLHRFDSGRRLHREQPEIQTFADADPGYHRVM
jgi:hypothetical protein